MPDISKLGKIKVGRLYLVPGGDIVRVVKINLKLNNLIVYSYHSHSNKVVQFDVAEESFLVMFKITEVARALGKKPATIRKYENQGLIPKAKKIITNPEGKAESRVYSYEDVEHLRRFFERRSPVGRPRRARNNPISKENVKNRLDQIKMKEKLNG